MNKVALIGNMTRDPAYKVGDPNITKFGMAVQRKGKNKEGDYDCDFINCVAFGKTADFIAKWFTKGSKIAIAGRIQTGSYTNKEGVKVYTTDVIAEEAEFVEKKGSEVKAETKTEEVKSDDGFMNIPEGAEDELPFN